MAHRRSRISLRAIQATAALISTRYKGLRAVRQGRGLPGALPFPANPEAADVFALGHAAFVLDGAIGEGGHQCEVEAADLGVLHREHVEDAVVGLDHAFRVFRFGHRGVVAEVGHHLGQALDACRQRGQAGVLAAHLLRDLFAEPAQAFAERVGAGLLFDRLDQELCEP